MFLQMHQRLANLHIRIGFICDLMCNLTLQDLADGNGTQNICANSPPSCLRYYHSVKALDSKENICDVMSRSWTSTVSFKDHTSCGTGGLTKHLHSESIN